MRQLVYGPSQYLGFAARAETQSASRAFQILVGSILFLTLALLAACGGGGGGGGGPSPGPGGNPATLTSIAVTPANPSVQAGASVQLIATGTYSNGTTTDVSTSATWASNATATATVAPGGRVTGAAAGSATISASVGGVSGSTTVTVTPVASLTYFHTFPNDWQPNSPLLQANDGNFYGTTRAGGGNLCQGGNFCGVLFRLTPAGVQTVMHAFGPQGTGEGWWPQAPLIQGSDGALYGMTAFGGAHGAGTIFRMTLGGTFTVLHSFGASASDGRVPTGGLVQASDGNFYGTTSVGGANSCFQVPGGSNNCGTIFRMSPAGVVTTIYSFGTSASDGVQPNGSLLQGPDGHLYGTTVDGGANACSQVGATNNCGTVFRITLAGAYTTLHSFGATPTDGVAPQGALILGVDGNFYGTTVSGGGNCFFPGCGTVFRMTTAGNVSVLYAFGVGGNVDGTGPSPYLIQARDGHIYGTTGSGGALGGSLAGTVFRLTVGGIKTTLHSFGPVSSSPSNPQGGLIQGTDNALYGVTFYGNGATGATIFRVVVQ